MAPPPRTPSPPQDAASSQRPRVPAVAVVVLAVVLLLVAVVLAVRPSTSAGEEELASARESALGLEASARPALWVDADGIADVRLGGDAGELTAEGLSLRGSVGACDYYTTSPWVPGAQLGAWLRGGEVVAVFAGGFDPSAVPVTVAGLAGEVASLADLPAASGGPAELVEAAVPWQDDPVQVPLWRLAGEDVQLVVADLDGSGVGYVEVRRPGPPLPAAPEPEAGCSLTPGSLGTLPDVPPDGLPELRWDGWAGLSLGMSEVDARQRVAFLDPRSDAPANRRCRLLLPVDDGTGLAHVSVRDGRVAGITIDAGSTVDGLAVGSPATGVRAVHPELTVSHIEFRWEQGLAVDWTFDEGRRLAVDGGAVEVAVEGLSLPVRSPTGRVSAVGVGDTC